MAGTSFYMFWFRLIPEMFSSFSAAFSYGHAFVCFSARLAVHYFAVYSVLGSKIKQTSTATATSKMVVWGCVIVLCSFLYRCLQNFTKQREKSHILNIWENVNYTTAYLKFLCRILKLSYIICLEYFWRYRKTEWIQILASSRFVDWALSRFF